jgi:hypothetical protein
MSPRTMTARYRGTCTTCGAAIARGTEIVWAGRGLTYHAGQCADHHDADATPAERTWKQRYGRCEDAPCCGCCS